MLGLRISDFQSEGLGSNPSGAAMVVFHDGLCYGMWRSLAARPVRDGEGAGPNPAIPTMILYGCDRMGVILQDPFPHGARAARGSLEPLILVRIQVGERRHDAWFCFGRIFWYHESCPQKEQADIIVGCRGVEQFGSLSGS